MGCLRRSLSSLCAFTGGLNWYRSMDIKWHQRKALKGLQVRVPAYFIGSENDVDLEHSMVTTRLSKCARSFRPSAGQNDSRSGTFDANGVC